MASLSKNNFELENFKKNVSRGASDLFEKYTMVQLNPLNISLDDFIKNASNGVSNLFQWSISPHGRIYDERFRCESLKLSVWRRKVHLAIGRAINGEISEIEFLKRMDSLKKRTWIFRNDNAPKNISVLINSMVSGIFSNIDDMWTNCKISELVFEAVKELTSMAGIIETAKTSGKLVAFREQSTIDSIFNNFSNFLTSHIGAAEEIRSSGDSVEVYDLKFERDYFIDRRKVDKSCITHIEVIKEIMDEDNNFTYNLLFEKCSQVDLWYYRAMAAAEYGERNSGNVSDLVAIRKGANDRALSNLKISHEALEAIFNKLHDTESDPVKEMMNQSRTDDVRRHLTKRIHDILAVIRMIEKANFAFWENREMLSDIQDMLVEDNRGDIKIEYDIDLIQTLTNSPSSIYNNLRSLAAKARCYLKRCQREIEKIRGVK